MLEGGRARGVAVLWLKKGKPKREEAEPLPAQAGVRGAELPDRRARAGRPPRRDLGRGAPAALRLRLGPHRPVLGATGAPTANSQPNMMN